VLYDQSYDHDVLDASPKPFLLRLRLQGIPLMSPSPMLYSDVLSLLDTGPIARDNAIDAILTESSRSRTSVPLNTRVSIIDVDRNGKTLHNRQTTKEVMYVLHSIESLLLHPVFPSYVPYPFNYAAHC
jgi:hypothetical protein